MIESYFLSYTFDLQVLRESLSCPYTTLSRQWFHHWLSSPQYQPQSNSHQFVWHGSICVSTSWTLLASENISMIGLQQCYSETEMEKLVSQKTLWERLYLPDNCTIGLSFLNYPFEYAQIKASMWPGWQHVHTSLSFLYSSAKSFTECRCQWSG